MTPGLAAFTTVVGIAIGGYETTHNYSASLSSPWSVDKFAQTPEDSAKVWRLFWESTGISLVFAIIISLVLNSWWTIIGAIIMIAFYWYLYNQALSHNL